MVWTKRVLASILFLLLVLKQGQLAHFEVISTIILLTISLSIIVTARPHPPHKKPKKA